MIEFIAKRFGRWRALVALVVIVIAAVALGGIVALLWNSLMPPLFGLREVTFLQALGLLVLARIFLGGIGRGTISDRWQTSERSARVTPEGREHPNLGPRENSSGATQG